MKSISDFVFTGGDWSHDGPFHIEVQSLGVDTERRAIQKVVRAFKHLDATPPSIMVEEDNGRLYVMLNFGEVKVALTVNPRQLREAKVEAYSNTDGRVE